MKKRPSYEKLEKHINALQIEIKELQRAKQVIEDSEAFHRLTVENISDTVIITDNDGKIIYACPNANIIFGLSQKQIYAKGAIQKLLEGNVCDLSELKNVKEISNIEWTVTDSFDQERFLLITVKTVSIKGGTVLYVMRDITNHMQTEKELSQIFSMSLDMICSADIKTATFLKVNPAFTEILGHSEEALLEKSFLDFVHPDDIDATRTAIEQKLPSEAKIIDFENRYRCKDGSYRWLSWVSRSNIKQGITYSVARDITERKQAEQERLANVHYLESMDRINRAIQGSNDFKQIMSDVLDETLSIFNADRAFLGYPCDPQASSWQIKMERTRPEYPGASVLKVEMPMDEDSVDLTRALLSSNNPVTIGPNPNFDYPLPANLTELFKIQSQMIMAIYPREDEPWSFGIHQCAQVRIWASEEVNLFKGIGHRIADSLTSLLMYRKLRESEAKYRRFMENSPGVIFRMAIPNGQYEYVSPSATTILGYTPQEWYDRPLLIKDIIHPDWQSYFKVQWKHLLNEIVPPSYEQQIIHKDGSTRWINQRNVAIRDENNRIIAIEGIITDITQRKNAEKKLAISKREWQVTFEAMSDWVALIDMDGKIRRSNPAVRNILGVSHKDIIGQFCCKLIHGSFTSCDRCAFNQAKKTWLMETVDTYINNKYLSISVDPVFDEQGQMISAIHIIRDNTGRKKIERELKISDTDLNEANTALKVLLAQRDKEKKDLETNFSEAVNGIILPFFNKIRQTRLNHLQKGYLDILESNLKEVVKPYTHRISSKLIHLTPSETRIVTYIKQGDRIKEIASKLSISPRTVEFHRDNIRKKLGIKNRKINLRTYLLNIS